jgi:hypothetical protein
MQPTSESLRQVIEEQYRLDIFADVKMEIEVNGYYDYELNFPESVDSTMFTDESVMRSRRPLGGLPKLIAGSGKVQSTEIEAEDIDETLIYKKSKIWYRTPGVESKYKYFRTKALTGTADGEDGFVFEDPQVFEATYDRLINLNKLVIGFEYANALPVFIRIELFQNDQWQSIGDFSPNDLGAVMVFYDGSWTDQEVVSNTFTSCGGIKVTVEELDTPSEAVELIQISPRLIFDLSDRVVDYSLNRLRDQVELDKPIGVSSASTASLTLENTDGFFNNENEESPLYELIDVNVKFIIQDSIDVNGEFQVIPHIMGYANSWDFDAQGQLTVDLSDYSKFFQSEKLDNSFYQKQDVRFVIADLVERAGIVNYEIRYAKSDAFNRIPYIFFDRELSIWQTIQDVAIAEQAVFYFDESGTFIWESRDYLWQNNQPDLELIGSIKEDQLPNIVSYSYSHQTVANVARVFFTPADLLKFGEELSNNFLWELDEETVLISFPLILDVEDESQYIEVTEDVFITLPDEGVLNVEAEFIRYSKERPENFDGEDDPQNVLYITERGVYNSTKTEHYTGTNEDYWKFETYWRGTRPSDFSGEDFLSQEPVFENEGAGGFPDVNKSQLILRSTRAQSESYAQYISKSEQKNFDVYGCSLQFPLSFAPDFSPFYDGDGIAGIVFNTKSDDNFPYQGYYVELVSSEYAAQAENAQREVRILKRIEGESDPVLLAGFFDSDLELSVDEVQEIFGTNLLVFPGKDYKIEIILDRGKVLVESIERNKLTINVVVNGTRIFSYTDVESDENPVYTEGSWGVYARGNTEVNFEYVFAVDRKGDAARLSRSQIAIRDVITGGFNDNVLEEFLREHNALRNEFFFDDFGAFAREVREFDVNHDIAPAVSTNLFVSNDTETYLVYYRRDQFSSDFAIGNRTRGPVVLSGDDVKKELSATMAVYGVPIEDKEQDEEEFRDDKSVWRRGEAEVAVESRWIQTRAQARRIGEWIVERWGRGVEFVSIETTIDSRLQLGDVVSIDMPENDLYGDTNRFHVVSIDKTVGTSPSQNMLLRRVEF